MRQRAEDEDLAELSGLLPDAAATYRSIRHHGDLPDQSVTAQRARGVRPPAAVAGFGLAAVAVVVLLALESGLQPNPGVVASGPGTMPAPPVTRPSPPTTPRLSLNLASLPDVSALPGAPRGPGG